MWNKPFEAKLGDLFPMSRKPPENAYTTFFRVSDQRKVRIEFETVLLGERYFGKVKEIIK